MLALGRAHENCSCNSTAIRRTLKTLHMSSYDVQETFGLKGRLRWMGEGSGGGGGGGSGAGLGGGKVEHNSPE